MGSDGCDQEQHSDPCSCGQPEGREGSSTTCGGGITVPTLEEQHILAQIRMIQKEAQLLKQTLRSLEDLPNPPQDRVTELREELLVLRQRRADLEERRICAAQERMRQLGHA